MFESNLREDNQESKDRLIHEEKISSSRSKQAKDDSNGQGIKDAQTRLTPQGSSHKSEEQHEETEVKRFSFSDQLDEPDSIRNLRNQDNVSEVLRGGNPSEEKVKKSHNSPSKNINAEIEEKQEDNVIESKEDQSATPQRNVIEAAEEQGNNGSSVIQISQRSSSKKQVDQGDSYKVSSASKSQTNEIERESQTTKALETPDRSSLKNQNQMKEQSSHRNQNDQKTSFQSSSNKNVQFIKVDEDFNIDDGNQIEGSHFDESSEFEKSQRSSLKSPENQRYSQRDSQYKTNTSQRQSVGQVQSIEESDEQTHKHSERNSQSSDQKGSSNQQERIGETSSDSRRQNDENLLSNIKKPIDNEDKNNQSSFQNTPDKKTHQSKKSSGKKSSLKNSPGKHQTEENDNSQSPDKQNNLLAAEQNQTENIHQSPEAKQSSLTSPNKEESTNEQRHKSSPTRSDAAVRAQEISHSGTEDQFDQEHEKEELSQNTPTKDREDSQSRNQSAKKHSNYGSRGEKSSPQDNNDDIETRLDQDDVQRVIPRGEERKKKSHITSDSDIKNGYNQTEDDARNERIRSILQGNENMFNEQSHRNRTQPNREFSNQNPIGIGEQNLQTITEESLSVNNPKHRTQKSLDNGTNERDSRSVSDITQDDGLDKSKSKRTEDLISEEILIQRGSERNYNDSNERSAVNQSQKHSSPGDRHFTGDQDDEVSQQSKSVGKPVHQSNQLIHNENDDREDLDPHSFRKKNFDHTFGKNSSKGNSYDQSQSLIKAFENIPAHDEVNVKDRTSTAYINPSEVLIQHFKSNSGLKEGGEFENRYLNDQSVKDEGYQTAKFAQILNSRLSNDSSDQQGAHHLSPIQQSIIKTTQMQQSKGSFGGLGSASDSNIKQANLENDQSNSGDQSQGSNNTSKRRNLNDIQKEVNITIQKHNEELSSRFKETPEPELEEDNQNLNKQRSSASKKQSGDAKEKSRNTNNQRSNPDSGSKNVSGPGAKSKSPSPKKDSAKKVNKEMVWKSVVEEGQNQGTAKAGSTPEASKKHFVYNPSPKSYEKIGSIKDGSGQFNSDHHDPSQVLSGYSKEASHVAEKDSEERRSQYVGRELEEFGSTYSEELFVRE